MDDREFLAEVLDLISLGRTYCQRYEAETKHIPCTLTRLEKLATVTRQKLKALSASPIGRPHANDCHRGPQLIDLTRRDQQRRARPVLSFANVEKRFS